MDHNRLKQSFIPAIAALGNSVMVTEQSRRPTYEYDGNTRGKVKRNGVEVNIASLSESERIDIGEEILRQTSERTGVPVNELRKMISGFASGESIKPVDGGFVVTKKIALNRANGSVQTPGDHKNRKKRRKESTLARRKAKRART